MKAGALREALKIAEIRDEHVATRDLLASGARIVIVVGEGAASKSIILVPAYAEKLRRDMTAAFNERIAENEAAMRERGVEP